MRLASVILAPLAFLFPGVIAGVHIDHRFLEQRFDRLFDLNLVGVRPNAKNVFVMLLAHQRGLLGQRRRLDNVVGLVHFALRSANFSSPFGVTKIL